MDGGEGQLVVLHGVDLAVEQVRGEVKAPRHRQAGILQAIAQPLGQQQAVGAGGHHHVAGPQHGQLPVPAGPGGQLHEEAIPFRPDPFERCSQPQIQLPAASGQVPPGLGHEGFGQGFVVHCGGGVADADGHDRFGARLAVDQGHLRFPGGDLLGLQQLHRREVGRELGEALPQQLPLGLAHRQHHLRGAEHAAVPFGRLEQVAVAANHGGGALHAEGLLDRVVGLDVAAVDGLAVAGGLGVDLGQLPIALHQGDAAQIGVARQFEQQGRAAHPAPHDQHIRGWNACASTCSVRCGFGGSGGGWQGWALGLGLEGGTQREGAADADGARAPVRAAPPAIPCSPMDAPIAGGRSSGGP